MLACCGGAVRMLVGRDAEQGRRCSCTQAHARWACSLAGAVAPLGLIAAILAPTHAAPPLNPCCSHLSYFLLLPSGVGALRHAGVLPDVSAPRLWRCARHRLRPADAGRPHAATAAAGSARRVPACVRSQAAVPPHLLCCAVRRLCFASVPGPPACASTVHVCNYRVTLLAPMAPVHSVCRPR